MPQISYVFYYFSVFILSFSGTITAVYFLTYLILDALVIQQAKFLYGTSVVGSSVINQLISIIN